MTSCFIWSYIERAVQTFYIWRRWKRILLKLMVYHISCYSIISSLIQPQEFHLLRCWWVDVPILVDLVLPNMSSYIAIRVQKKPHADSKVLIMIRELARSQTLQLGDAVNVPISCRCDGWLPVITKEENGPLSFRLQDGQVVRWHNIIDHIIKFPYISNIWWLDEFFYTIFWT